MTFSMLFRVAFLALLTAFLINQYKYLDADWCSSEITTLRLQVDEIHTEIINE